MSSADLYQSTIALFDAANSEDPNMEGIDDREYPKELLYAWRMTEMQERYAPEASEAARLAIRAQHIQRWKIPRNSYPMDRQGYLKSVADELGLSLMEAAGGIAKIAEFKMADIIRKMTVEKGYDPRDFVLFAFGGAGPVHAAVFGAELGVQKGGVPLREIASTWCAFGAAAADILHVYEQVDIQGSPFDPARVNKVLAELQARAEAQMEKDGIARARRKFSFSLDMRHRGQINEVEVMLPEGRLKGAFFEPLRSRFYARADSLEQMIAYVDSGLIQSQLVELGDQVVLVCGFPVGTPRPPNMALLHTVGEKSL